MEVETGLPPPHIRLQSKILRAITRTQTLPDTHLLTLWHKKATTNGGNPTTFASNLEDLVKQYPEQMITKIETIILFIRLPWWENPVQIHIELSKVKAKQYYDTMITTRTMNSHIACIYTYGSGIDGQIGAAVYNIKTSDTRKQYLGT
jgi:hypothetical protein